MTKLAERTPVLPSGVILGASGRWAYQINNGPSYENVHYANARRVDGVVLHVCYVGHRPSVLLRRMARKVRSFERGEAKLP